MTTWSQNICNDGILQRHLRQGRQESLACKATMQRVQKTSSARLEQWVGGFAGARSLGEILNRRR